MTTARLLLALSLAALCVPRPLRAESFAAWAAKAERARKAGDAAAALSAYTDALRLWTAKDGGKAKTKVLLARAGLCEKSGDLKGALKDLSSALALEPKNAALYDRRGEVFLRLSDPKNAIGDFYKAVSLDLNLKEAYFHRANAYALQGDKAFAREDYRTACGLGHKRSCALAAGGKPAPPVDTSFRACRKSLDSCADRTSAYGACVAKAKACEDGPRGGCCPRACLRRFRDLLDAEESEAEAFRQVFAEDSACAVPPR